MKDRSNLLIVLIILLSIVAATTGYFAGRLHENHIQKTKLIK
jgi:hypothetical protein